jgi:hypothetical protein
MITVHYAIVNNLCDSNPIHFKEDDVRVKRSRFRHVILSAIVILSEAKDLCRDCHPERNCHPERSEGSLRPSSQPFRCPQGDRPSLQMSILSMWEFTPTVVL